MTEIIQYYFLICLVTVFSKDMEERYRKAMIANAQLDNERASNTYQIQLLKDKVEEMEEIHAQLQREHKDKCREFDTLKRTNEKLMEDLRLVQGQLDERDTLIANEGTICLSINFVLFDFFLSYNIVINGSFLFT